MESVNNAIGSVMVTGASGFVGSRLCRVLLDEGWIVHALHGPASDLSQLPKSGALHLHPTVNDVGQITTALRQASPRVVIHLASLFLPDHRPEQVANLVDSNITFGTNVLEAMRATGIRRFVNTGTSWQHYEDADYDPVNLYAATKQAFEDILRYYVEAHGFKAITLKLFDTFGPGDPRPKVLNLLLRAAKSGASLDMSPGEQVLNLVHVEDVCRAFVRGVELIEDESSGHPTFAIASGEWITLRALVDLINEVSPGRVRVNWGKRSYRTREVMAPWSGGVALPGWAPRIALRRGLEEMFG